MGFFAKSQTVITPIMKTDLPAVTQIHRHCFQLGWGLQEFESLFRRKGVWGLGARIDHKGGQKMCGFVVVRSVCDEAEIITLAVRPTARKMGIGKALMSHLVRNLYADRVKSLYLEVGDNNHAALALYRSMKFEQVGMRKHYYRTQSGSEDSASQSNALMLKLAI